MKIKKFNEDVDNTEKTEKTLRDLIGDIKEEKKYVTETTKGCFTNLDNLSKYLDHFVEIEEMGQPGLCEVYLYKKEKSKRNGEPMSALLNGYLDGDKLRILSTFPGDERGSFIFGDVFISSGHDGNYLWNVKTGEFGHNSW